MSNKSGVASQVLPLPSGGGALQGIGETFAPDLFTGAGNLTVPIAVPPGRNGFQPTLSLSYSTGNGNGAFGLGWALSTPEVTRKTSRGVPRYLDDSADPDELDTFLLSGAEELVPDGPASAGVTRFRPRTEGLFARIERVRDGGDVWQVLSRDGQVSRYGVPGVGDAVVANPRRPANVFSWKLSETSDPLGNRISYEYRRDADPAEPARWEQLYLEQVRYVDHDDGRFLVSVSFDYGERPDAFSVHRAGFEVRTRLRCKRIEVRTHPTDDEGLLVLSYELIYLDERVQDGELDPGLIPPNGISLLSRVRIVGHDRTDTQELPPLDLDYSTFDLERRRFQRVEGSNGTLPRRSLADADLELVDLFGNGLPDIVEMNGATRFWRNLGNGLFDIPRTMTEVPSDVHLSDPGTQFCDLNGDGRADLLSLTRGGYFPLSFAGRWSPQGFVRYTTPPSVPFADGNLRFVDLDGDGVVDALRTGSSFELFFNDPVDGWGDVEIRPRGPIAEFPDVNFSDPRVKLGDLCGDGLQDIALVEQGRIDYWPYLGHGRWGRRVTMINSPIFRDQVLPPGRFDPQRVLLGDIDGDGLDDIVYIEPDRVTLWINQAGNGWGEPIIIDNTPRFADIDAVRLVDMLGTGTVGILWTNDAAGPAAVSHQFLDLAGAIKPYLLAEVTNHRGTRTRIRYAPSTEFYLADGADPRTRWSAPLPFAVHVVVAVEVVDEISGGRLTSEYRYHHGYWDGAERELRGFGLVEQLDTSTLEQFPEEDTGGGGPATEPAAPTLRKTWFHLGPVGEEDGPREEADLSGSFWPEDPPFLAALVPEADPSALTADALRALRGSVLRTELYGLDGAAEQGRPYLVTEARYDVREESVPPAGGGSHRVFFPHLRAERSTRWDRGNDPMVSLTLLDSYDDTGQPLVQTQVGCPRGWRSAADRPEGSYLATRTTTVYARPVAGVPITDRVASTTIVELPGFPGRRLADVLGAPEAALKLVGQTVSHYDGAPFVGLPLGQVGQVGLLVRSQTLVVTEDVLAAVHAGGAHPPYLAASGVPAWTAEYPDEFRELLPDRAGYDFADGTDGRARGWFAETIRRRYDVQDPGGGGRGLLVAVREPTGGPETDSTVRYDRFGLFAVEVMDAAGLVTRATHDYRVLRPRQVTDPNGLRTVCSYTPLGLLQSAATMAPPGEPDGDTAAAPGVRYRYDLRAFAERGEPVSAHTIRRVHRARAPVPTGADPDAVVESVEYSDGFGRLVQTRTVAEDVLFGDPEEPAQVFGHEVVPADPAAPGSRDPVAGRVCPPGAVNVVVSGAVRYDDKGRVIERSEQFFGTGLGYQDPRQVTPLTARTIRMRYDPIGRLLATEYPDGSRSQVVYGVPLALDDPDRFRPTPWESFTYDPNDNAGRTHPDSSAAFREHRNTPASALVDALGRTAVAVQRTATAELRTRSEYDIRGNRLVVIDPLGRIACRFAYDLANRPLRVESIDAGVRRSVLDAAGSVVERRDGKGALLLQAYDALLRPIRLWARDDAAAAVTLRERLEYGDDGRPDQPAAQREAAQAAHRLGRLHQHYDEAGRLTFDAYDFSGNVRAKLRRVIDDHRLLAVFPVGPDLDWTVPAFRMNWQPPEGVTLEQHAEAMLEPTALKTAYTYDALGRVASALGTDLGGGADREQLHFGYNRAGSLERVRLDDQDVVEHIAYNAAGQRTLVSLAGGIVTRYAYHRGSGRLARLRTERCAVSADRTEFRPSGPVLQDYAYSYDLVGSPIGIVDRSPGCGVRGNPEAAAIADPALRALVRDGDALVRTFGFDPLYRLVSATGRECTASPAVPPWEERQPCGFGVPDQGNAPDLTSLYRQRYDYNDAGSLTRIRHTGSSGFTRGFRRNASTNRLLAVASGDNVVPYEYDDNGNQIAETQSRQFEWDHGDRMKAFRTQVGTAEPSVHVHYLCDAGGHPVKKFVRRQGGEVESTVEVDGLFVRQRFRGGENLLVQVMDKDRIVALVRRGPAHPRDGGPAVQLHLGDHLGSSTVVVDQAGGFVNREELTPYGEPCFGGYGRKRYRLTGQEREEESGLSRHGLRRYAPWQGSWTSCDPNGAGSATSPYAYANGNPIRLVDPDGLDGQEPRLNFSFGLTFTVGSLEQNLSLNASVTTQVPIGPVGLEGGARADLSLYQKRMGVSEWGAVAGTTYFAGSSFGSWNTTAAKHVGISSPTLSFPGSGLTTSDRRVALGFGWTTFTDLKVSTGNRILLEGGLGGQSLDQRVGHYYLRTDLDDQSGRLIVSNDTFVRGKTDWFETMSVQMIASAMHKGSTLEMAAGVRALTDPIVMKPDASGKLQRQHTGPEPGAPKGYYLTHDVGANAFPLYLRFTSLDSGGSLKSFSLGVDEPSLQLVQDLIHMIIDASFFRKEAVRGLFWQLDLGQTQRGSK